ncbi:hydrid cluster protein-associated redox disulfide domain protein [Oribacterium sp. oral taxon 078 str. F0263]|nr:hydrid cluster protein-associated redox disulfide domain protein [Oribacterium sp. oral taxon 078 str. F0263]
MPFVCLPPYDYFVIILVSKKLAVNNQFSYISADTQHPQSGPELLMLLMQHKLSESCAIVLSSEVLRRKTRGSGQYPYHYRFQEGGARISELFRDRNGGITMAKVSKDMLVGELVNTHPELIDTLLDVGMHCLGCPSSQMESLEDACLVHGLNPNEVLSALNTKLAELEA